MEGKISVCLALLAAFFTVASCRPGFCRGYDCPDFERKSSNQRSYAESTWVGVSRVSDSSDGITNGMFMNLFRYIQGDNTRRQKIAMTVPVLTKVENLGGSRRRYTMMFYLDVANPPSPTNRDVRLMTLPARDVYVRSFSKWFFMASNRDYENEANRLRASIGDSSLYDANTYYQVGYSSPWWPIKKYHEVWIDSA